MSPRRRADRGQEQSIFSLTEPRFSQSLERGLAVLGCFTPQTPVLGIAEIADTLSMSRSTTHRYVVTLLELGYLEQGTSRKYRLGLRVTDLGLSALNATGLREHAHPLLEELRQRLSYSASLAVLDGPEIVYVDRVRSLLRGSEADLGPQPGSRLPAGCTAMGKILVAGLPEPEYMQALGEVQLGKRAPNTIRSRRELSAELARVREAGMAVEDEEREAGLVAIAAPVRDQSGQTVAAIDISAPAAAIGAEELMDALGPHVLTTADRVSARLGYRRAHEIALG